MQQLRQRFDGHPSEPSESGDTLFSHSSSSTVASSKPPRLLKINKPLTESPSMGASIPTTSSRRHLAQAGDLLTSTQSEGLKQISRSYSLLNTPRPRAQSPTMLIHTEPELFRLDEEEGFDLRQEVMNCIYVSIGLDPNALPGDESVEASPAFSPTDASRTSRGASGTLNSFGSLSLLEMGDDLSSATGASSTTANNYMTGLDNEVEILFFPAGSHLARAGERDTGAIAIDSWVPVGSYLTSLFPSRLVLCN